jgi:hypothetical protein
MALGRDEAVLKMRLNFQSDSEFIEAVRSHEHFKKFNFPVESLYVRDDEVRYNINASVECKTLVVIKENGKFETSKTELREGTGPTRYYYFYLVQPPDFNPYLVVGTRFL